MTEVVIVLLQFMFIVYIHWCALHSRILDLLAFVLVSFLYIFCSVC